ncbi:50S ribosomal protein L32e [Candidatus Woesearchaeota archaeon]|nr:50S ribosomal protein L32e [Candidatus Woesearchaeota archaeon]
MKLLDLRNMMNKKKPKFLRQDTHKKKKLAKNWRKPRGIDSKLRLQFGGRAPMVSVGYKSPKEVRGLNRDGLKEISISNVSDLKLVVEGCIGLISSTVGMRKKSSIIEEAKKLNVKLANADESVLEKISNSLKERKEKKQARVKAKADKEKSEKEKAKEAKAKETKESSEAKKTKEEEKKEKDKALIKKDAI